MEISPDQLCDLIHDPMESSPDEVLELVDTYLFTTVDLLVEAVSKRVSSCSDKCRSKKHPYCRRLIDSLLNQLEPLRNTDFITPEAKLLLKDMEISMKEE